MYYYEVYVGSRSIRVLATLGEVYKVLKDIHSECYFHLLHPLFHLKNLKDNPVYQASYVLYEQNDQLYIRLVQVVKKETSNVINVH